MQGGYQNQVNRYQNQFTSGGGQQENQSIYGLIPEVDNFNQIQYGSQQQYPMQDKYGGANVSLMQRGSQG